MRKSIIIIGSSGTGKSTALREAFGIAKGYGCKSALSQIPRQGYQYMPELTGNVEQPIRNELHEFFANGNTTVIDAHPNFLNVIQKYYDEAEFIQLVATNEDIIRNVVNRRSTKGDNDKDTKIKNSINDQYKLKSKGHKQMNQQQVIDYIKSLVGENPQQNLF